HTIWKRRSRFSEPWLRWWRPTSIACGMTGSSAQLQRKREAFVGLPAEALFEQRPGGFDRPGRAGLALGRDHLGVQRAGGLDPALRGPAAHREVAHHLAAGLAVGGDVGEHPVVVAVGGEVL